MTVLDPYPAGALAPFPQERFRGSGLAPVPNVYGHGTRAPLASFLLSEDRGTKAGPDQMTSAAEPSKAAAIATIAALFISLVGFAGELITGQMVYGALVAFGLTVLAALVLAHGER